MSTRLWANQKLGLTSGQAFSSHPGSHTHTHARAEVFSEALHRPSSSSHSASAPDIFTVRVM